MLSMYIPMQLESIKSLGVCGLGSDQWSLWEMINPIIKETPQGSLTLQPCEDTKKRRTSVDQEVGFHQTPNLMAP